MLKTEMRNPKTTHIDTMDTMEMMKIIDEENHYAADAVGKELEHIGQAVDAVAFAFSKGGRLFYIGAGTSGRLGVLDASECPPTYGVPQDMVIGIIAGGKEALWKAGEANEDDPQAGVEELKNYQLKEQDIVVGISAAGGAAYVINALEYAKSIGCVTVGVTSNEGSPLDLTANISICTDTGAEVVTGSTRMKAGTAQKLVLNMISTGAMIKSGYVYENMMINLKPSNVKLKDRTIRIVCEILHISYKEAEAVLERTDWSIRNAVETRVKEIIEKWYLALHFPQKYKEEFYKALEEIEIPASVSIETYDLKEQNGKKNLLSFLYMCEALEKKYEEKGISKDILMDTLQDIVRWNDTWSELKGELYLGEIGWLQNHMRMDLFKLGRLQFAFGKSYHDIPQKNIQKGEPVMEIHIPADGPLTHEECVKSVEMAKEFFAAYYPEYKFEYFTCHSWLIDTALKDILDPDSNILQFQSMFDVIEEDDSDAILRYVFKWNTNSQNLAEFTCTTGMSKKVKETALAGKVYHESLGVFHK